MDEWEIYVQWGDNFKWDLKKVVDSNHNLIWYVSVISLISYSDETNWLQVMVPGIDIHSYPVRPEGDSLSVCVIWL